jgi:hypothetical protein
VARQLHQLQRSDIENFLKAINVVVDAASFVASYLDDTSVRYSPNVEDLVDEALAKGTVDIYPCAETLSKDLQGFAFGLHEVAVTLGAILGIRATEEIVN